MPATQSDTVKDFFKLVITGGSQHIPSIMALFVPDQPQPPGPPNIGLTTGGPTFTTQNGIDNLFKTLKKSLPQYGLDPTPNPNNPQLLIGVNQISVEAILNAGKWKHSWDPSPPVPKSRPLSHVKGTDEGGSGGITTQLSVCAVFTLDSNSPFLIRNLALYFDRWKLAHDKWDKTNPNHIDK
jgi:hypothetical protein